MAIKYGIGSTRIKNGNVLAYYTNNMTNISAGDVNDGFQFYSTNTQGGCGNPNGDAGVLIVLKDDISWNRVTCQFEFDGTASCWSFLGGGTSSNSAQNENYNFGRSGPNVPPEMASGSAYNVNTPGNIFPYNESLGDRIFWTTNSFDDSSNFIRKASACDNNNTNMFHGAFNDSGYKSFWTTRRRNLNGNNAGIFFGRSCSSVGSYIRIKNIFVWYQG